MMNINQLLNEGIEELRRSKIENPIMHARIILEFILQKNREYIIINDKEDINSEKQIAYMQSIKRLANGEPIQYITHHQEFMKLDFYVDNNVLIPRADTEILVEETLKYINNLKNKTIKVLDMCTGSGAIAISIAKYTENVEVYATDISPKALEIANKNAIKNGIEHKCKFIYSDMFQNISEKFDIIISNPPYIKSSIINKLDLNVQREPQIALDGGEDGLNFYKIIAENAYKFLAENGIILLEIGYDQKDEVINLLEKIDKYKNIYSKKDLSQNDRIICAIKLEE